MHSLFLGCWQHLYLVDPQSPTFETFLRHFCLSLFCLPRINTMVQNDRSVSVCHPFPNEFDTWSQKICRFSLNFQLKYRLTPLTLKLWLCAVSSTQNKDPILNCVSKEEHGKFPNKTTAGWFASLVCYLPWVSLQHPEIVVYTNIIQCYTFVCMEESCCFFPISIIGSIYFISLPLNSYLIPGNRRSLIHCIGKVGNVCKNWF